MPRRPAHRPRLEPLEDRTAPAAGQLDPTFGTGGRAFPDLGGFGTVYGVATQPDGKILVAGETNGFLESDVAVARLTPTGQLDPTFGTGGVYTLDLGGFESAGAVFPRPDGSVLVSAYSDTPGGAVVVVRLTAGGQPDPTFGSGGLARVGFGGSFEFGGVAGVLADGRIVLAGRSDFDFSAARLTAAGQLDPTFGVGGAVVDAAGPDRDSRGFVLQPDGKVVVVGYTQSGPNPHVAAVRFTSAGQLDPGFGTGGRVQIDFGSFVVPEGVAVQSDGSLVLGGFNDAPGVRDFAALRLSAAGQLDTTFGTGGLAVVDFGFEDSAVEVVVQPNGAIVLGGHVNTAPVFSYAAARLTPAGQPDPTFGTDGRVVHPYSDFDQAGGVGLQPDGKVFILGSHQEPGVGSFPMVIRLTADTAPNTPPSISDVANQTVPAGGSTGALVVTVSDTETTAASLNLTAMSSNPALVPAGAIVLGGSGGSRTVTVTPASGQFGSATITLTVTDGGGLTAADAFTIDVPLPPPPPLPLLLPSAPITVAGTGYDTPANAMSVAAGDFNADGRPDAVVGSSGGITVFLNDGTGAMGGRTDYPTGSAFPRFVRVADLTGDGKPEVIAANDIGQSLSIFRGVGDGTFQTAVQVPAGTTNLQGFAVADFTGDGKPDVAVVTDGGVALLTNVGGIGILGAPAAVSAVGGTALDTADFNHDGKADLVVANSDGGRLVVYLGAGNGTFGAGLTVPTGVGSLPVGVIARRADGGLLDWNGDGHADLAAGCSDAGMVQVFLGNGAGGFTPSAVLNPGFPRAGRLAAADFDADGFLDLVVQVSGGGSPTTQPVFVGDGAGGFTGVAQVNTSGDTDVTAADVNGDGRPDVLGTVSFSPGYLGVSLNTTPVVASFQVSAPATVPIGVPFSMTVTAKAAGGATFAGYKGVVRFTSTDGSAVLPADLRFTPDDNGVRTVTVTLNATGPWSVTVRDRVLTGVSATAAVAVNTNPTADTDAFTVGEDAAATPVPVLTNDTTAPDTGEMLTVTQVTPAAHGVVALAGGVVTYAPASNYSGPDAFTYTVSDGNGGTAVGTVTVTVAPVNDSPTAAADAFLTPAGAPITLPVLANDSAAPDAGEALAVTAVTQPAAGGTVAVAPGGGGVVFTPGAGFVGTAAFTYTVGDGTPGSSATAAVTVTVASGAGPVRPVAAGGAADGSVRLVTADGATRTVAPFGATGTPTRTASGDVDGDGVADVVAVTGPGAALRVAVLSGADGSVLVAPFDPFGGDFTGGGYVAAGDLDGDGKAEFAVTPDQGGGPRVTVFGTTGGGTVVRANFLGIDDANFRGGARAAIGDVNGDGTPDLIVAAGFGGGPRTAIFTGQSVLAGIPTRLVGDFFAFPGSDATNLRNGSFVAAGDVTGDGFAELIFGGGPGGAPRVFILSGALVAAGQVGAAQASPVANYFVAGDVNDRGGARVAVTNADGDARADVAVGSGAGRPARVRLYLGKDFGGGGEPPATDLDVLGGAVLADGVYVG